MRRTISHEQIDCDICKERDIGEPEIVSVNGIPCDVCYKCYGPFKRTVAFLVNACGLEITYSEMGES